MTHEPNDLLISAYLDGELTADERVQVEKLLATNAEVRQLVEELKAIRAGLQSLPQQRLEPDFAQQVLRRAEQAAKSPAAHPESKAAILAGHDYWDAKPSVFRSKRGIAWSLVAVAAAVIIMVATRHDEGPNREVAKAPAVQHETNLLRSAEDKVAHQMTAEKREKQMQPAMAVPLSAANSEMSAADEASKRIVASPAPPQAESSGNLVHIMRQCRGSGSGNRRRRAGSG